MTFNHRFRGPFASRGRFKLLGGSIAVAAVYFSTSQVSAESFYLTRTQFEKRAGNRKAMTLPELVSILCPLPGRMLDESRTVAAAELLRQNKVFQAIDSSGDGLISFEEFTVLSTFLMVPQSRLELMFNMFDSDFSGAIDEKELKAVISAVREDLEEIDEETLNRIKRFFFGRRTKLELKDFVKKIASFQQEILHACFVSLGESPTACDVISMICHNKKEFL
jgi:hypothetical protein